VLIDTDELYLGGKAKKMNRDTAVNENDWPIVATTSLHPRMHIIFWWMVVSRWSRHAKNLTSIKLISTNSGLQDQEMKSSLMAWWTVIMQVLLSQHIWKRFALGLGQYCGECSAIWNLGTKSSHKHWYSTTMLSQSKHVQKCFNCKLRESLTFSWMVLIIQNSRPMVEPLQSCRVKWWGHD
jgi:hypothetical protein